MWLKRLLSKLDSLEWSFTLGLALPAAAYIFTLRTIRVLERGDVEGILGWIDLYKSDVFFLIAFVLIGLGVLRLVQRTWARVVTFVSLQMFAGAAVVLEATNLFFFKATGSTIDFSIIHFFLTQVSETSNVVASETPTASIILAAGGGVGALVLPWLLALIWSKFVAPHVGEPPRREATTWNGMKAVAGVALLFVAGLPTFQERSLTFARNSFLNVGVSFANTMMESSAGEDLNYTDTSTAKLRPRRGEGHKNLVIVVMESTRASATTIHNPDLETTPHLARLAAESIVAERAHAVVPHTSKALVAILCGIEPRLNMPITESLPDGIPGRCMADLLAEVGYDTAFFQSATQRFEGRDQLVENMGYETFVPVEKMSKSGFSKANYFGYEDDIMLEPSADWLDKRSSDKPFFTTYLTLTPHHDYLAPRRYGRHDFDEDDEFNRYLNAVHYVDAFINNVVELYKEKGLYEDTVFVFVGDHGEGFGEHDRRQHDNVIWQEGLHVPLVIHEPGRDSVRDSVDELVTQLDIVPTLTKMLGYDIVNADFPGADMLDLPEDRVVRAHCWYERRCMARIQGHEKFIHHFGGQPDEFYDLQADPKELNDLAPETRGLDELKADLVRWRTRVNSYYRSFNREKLDAFVFDDEPEVAHEIDVTYGSFARLVGYEMEPEGALRPGSKVTVTYYFKALSDIPEGWKLFVHGEDHRKRMTNLDHVPVRGLHPLTDWEPGTYIADEHQFRIPANARNTYKLYMGLWHKKIGRAEVSGDVETDGDRRVLVAEIPLETRRQKR